MREQMQYFGSLFRMEQAPDGMEARSNQQLGIGWKAINPGVAGAEPRLAGH